MSKADITKIEGFDTMTPEQKTEALLNYEFDDKADELSKLKKSYDSVASELAKAKKEAREKLSEDEKNKLAFEERERELAELRKEVAITRDVNSLKSIGFDDEDSSAIASALADSNLQQEGKEALWKTLKAYTDKQTAKIKAELVGGMPKPNGAQGQGGTPMTKEQILAIRDTETRLKAIQENIELFTKSN